MKTTQNKFIWVKILIWGVRKGVQFWFGGMQRGYNPDLGVRKYQKVENHCFRASRLLRCQFFNCRDRESQSRACRDKLRPLGLKKTLLLLLINQSKNNWTRRVGECTLDMVLILFKSDYCSCFYKYYLWSSFQKSLSLGR